MVREDLIDLKFSAQEIERKIEKIYREILAGSENLDRGNFERIGTENFKRLFELYDLYFFNGFFQDNYNEKVFFRLSRRMTRAGGKTEYAKHSGIYVISLSATLIFQTFQDIIRDVTVCGIVCRDRLEATMRILEHEIIHLLELVLFDSSSCAQPQFKQLSHHIFGHTDVTHQLVTQKERAREKFNLSRGDEVQFEFEGKVYRGIISRITKRATVMVKDSKGQFVDAHGKRYMKCYVPLPLLRPAKEKCETS